MINGADNGMIREWWSIKRNAGSDGKENSRDELIAELVDRYDSILSPSLIIFSDFEGNEVTRIDYNEKNPNGPEVYIKLDKDE